MPRPHGEPSYQTPSRTTSWVRPAAPLNRLAEDLALALGCPVEVSFLPETLHVVVVAHPEPGRDVRVSMPALHVWLRPLDNPYFSLKHDLLKQLRRQIGQKPGDG